MIFWENVYPYQQAYPSPLNFKGFPKSISTSVNNVAAHGIPDGRALESGDIVNIDITVFKDGFHGDCSDTFPVGVIDDAALKLIQVTRQCLGTLYIDSRLKLSLVLG